MGVISQSIKDYSRKLKVIEMDTKHRRKENESAEEKERGEGEKMTESRKRRSYVSWTRKKEPSSR